MKGLAPPETLTGKVQRVIAREWMSYQDVLRALPTLKGTEQNSVRYLLERLVREGRASQRRNPDTRYMSGYVTEYRGLAGPGQVHSGQEGGEASGPSPTTGVSGNDGNPGATAAEVKP